MNPWKRRQVIGDSVLYLGDSREVLATLDPVDMVLTDPPYGHNNNNNGDLIHRREAALGVVGGRNGTAARPIANDGAEANDLFRSVLPTLNALLRSGGCCCCCCGGGGPDPQFARWSLWLDEVFDFKQMVVWDKGPIGMGWHYRRSYETVLVAQKRGGACKWYDETDRVENIIRPGQNGIAKIIPLADDHPTPKPVELAAHFVRLHTKRGDTVLDPFAGAGWVGVACAQMGRRFVGIEIEEKYFSIACRRIEDAQRQGRLFEDQPAKPEKKPGLTIPTWLAYSAAYLNRYGVDPVRNRTVNGQLAAFVSRLGADAPAAAAYYLTTSRSLYVQASHPVNLMLRDCEGLHTEMLTGKHITDTRARQVDKRRTTYDAFAPLIAEAQAREKIAK